jgi:hypothetical protein
VLAAAVTVHGGDADQRAEAASVELPEFGQLADQGRGGDRPYAWDGLHQSRVGGVLGRGLKRIAELGVEFGELM